MGHTIADWGFSVVHLPQIDRTAVEALADHGLEALAEVLPERSQASSGSIQRLEDQTRALLDKGVTGICCRHAHEIPAMSWRVLLQAAKAAQPKAWFCAEALGRPVEDLWALKGAGFDYLLSSVGWWNGFDPWFFDQQPLFQRVARSIGFPVCEPGSSPHDRLHRYRPGRAPVGRGVAACR